MESEEAARLKPLIDAFAENPPLQCERCGRCCSLPTEMDLFGSEVSAIAKHEKIGVSDFKWKYGIKRMRSGMWLMPTAPCPFLEGKNTCTIYDLRPATCRCYPFGHLRGAFYDKNRRFTVFCPMVLKVFNYISSVMK